MCGHDEKDTRVNKYHGNRQLNTNTLQWRAYKQSAKTTPVVALTEEMSVKVLATGLSTTDSTMIIGRTLRATTSALFTPSALGSSSPKKSVVTVSAAVAYARPADPKIWCKDTTRRKIQMTHGGHSSQFS